MKLSHDHHMAKLLFSSPGKEDAEVPKPLATMTLGVHASGPSFHIEDFCRNSHHFNPAAHQRLFHAEVLTALRPPVVLVKLASM